MNLAIGAKAGGTLVPFLGSGMSRKNCVTWPDLIRNLELEAGRGSGPLSPGGAPESDLELIRRGARASERIRRRDGAAGLAGAVGRALIDGERRQPPPQIVALAQFDWPLVITTNYDDLYIAALHRRKLRTRVGSRSATAVDERQAPPALLLGRGPADCQRVLGSLHRPGPPIIWAVQGFVGGQAMLRLDDGQVVAYQDFVRWGRATGGASQLAELREQIVVGHAEYRRVATSSSSFRRSFAEVFRNRSLFFLGSGLQDRYLLDLFDEIVEYYGPGNHPHFAVIRRGTQDVDFLRKSLGVWALEIDDYGEIPDVIGGICQKENVLRTRVQLKTGRRDRFGELTVSEGQLPTEVDARTCVLLSGGGSGVDPRLPDWSRKYVRAIGLDGPLEKVGDPFLWRQAGPHDGPAVLVVRARLSPVSVLGRRLRPLPPSAERSNSSGERRGRLWRDLRLVGPALSRAIDVAAQLGKSRLLSPLLAAGDLRVSPPAFVLQEMIRTWSSSPRPNLDLEIFVVDHSVIADLRTGRIDVSASSATDGWGGYRPVQFWFDLESDSRERVLEARIASMPLIEFLEDHHLDNDRWEIDVWPQPCLQWMPWTVDDIKAWQYAHNEVLTLERFGVTVGSTLLARQL